MDGEVGHESGWDKRRAAISMRIEIAGMELCLERGVDNVTVEEIARAAGISRRTFYRYFDTIDHILCAMPERALHQISRDMRKRPVSESIRESCVYVTRNIERSGEELRIHQLAVQIAQNSQTAWWRAMSRMQTLSNDVYSAIIADRLRATGRDPAAAPIIAAAILAIIVQVCAESDLMKWLGPDPDLLDAALRSVGEILGEPSASAKYP